MHDAVGSAGGRVWRREPGAEEQENGASAQAEEEFVQPESVEINSTNFQDTDFQNYVKQYDKDGNDSLSLEERNKVITSECQMTHIARQ